MKISVFGKTGQVARELAQYSDVICLDRSTADLTQPEQCAKLIRQYRPDAVINAAAYTQVDGAETEEPLATVLNADAPTAMAVACAAIGVGLFIFRQITCSMGLAPPLCCQNIKASHLVPMGAESSTERAGLLPQEADM